jgi:uncharacterized coiled-coil protein SlyX
MSSPSLTRPPHLEEDLMDDYRRMLLDGEAHAAGPPVAMSYLAGLAVEPPAGHRRESDIHLPTGPAQGAPEDPMGPLEVEERPVSRDSDHPSEAGRTILPRPRLNDPNREPNLHPAPASDMSRPVSPFHAEYDPKEWNELADEGNHRDDFIPGSHPSTGLEPLLLNNAATDAFRRRVREGLSGIDEGKPVPTLDSLMAMVDELVKFESRLSKLEKEVARDRATLSHAMSMTAKSETAASEMRMVLQVEALRMRLDSLKTATTPAVPKVGSVGLSPSTPTGQAMPRSAVPRSERL